MNYLQSITGFISSSYSNIYDKIAPQQQLQVEQAVQTKPIEEKQQFNAKYVVSPIIKKLRSKYYRVTNYARRLSQTPEEEKNFDILEQGEDGYNKTYLTDKLAVLSYASYFGVSGEESFLQSLKKELSLDRALEANALIKDDVILPQFSNEFWQVHCNKESKEVIVIFRGTADMDDIKEDYSILMEGQPKERLNEFIELYSKEMHPNLISRLQKEQYKVIFSGHSLGGCLAEEAYVDLNNKGLKVDFAESFNRGSNYLHKEVQKEQNIVSHHMKDDPLSSGPCKGTVTNLILLGDSNIKEKMEVSDVINPLYYHSITRYVEKIGIYEQSRNQLTQLIDEKIMLYKDNMSLFC